MMAPLFTRTLAPKIAPVLITERMSNWLPGAKLGRLRQPGGGMPEADRYEPLTDGLIVKPGPSLRRPGGTDAIKEMGNAASADCG